MNKLIAVVLAAASLLFASSCSNEIDTNADYKEIMVVYGMLNPNDTVHYIRVNKAFLTDGGSALEAAKDNSNIYYDSIEVKIDEFDISLGTPLYKASYILTKDISQAKDTGIFANYPNVLYTFTQPLNQEYLYRLTVTNKLTGNVATAETEMVHDPTLGSPSSISSKYLIDPDRNIVLSWTGGKNSKIYDMDMRFYWDVYDSATNQVIDSNLYVDWNMVQGRTLSVSGQIRNNIPGSNFYSFLGLKLPYLVGQYRVAKKIDFIYWGADEEFYLYRSVNTPSVGIVQAKPEYTNISNGNYGLFATRNRFVIEGVTISDKTVTFLQTTAATKNLKFR